MTLREKICEAGVDTFREFVCLGIGEGGGGITIITEVYSLMEENAIILSEVSTTSPLQEEVVAQIVEVNNTDSLQEAIGEQINGIC